MSKSDRWFSLVVIGVLMEAICHVILSILLGLPLARNSLSQ